MSNAETPITGRINNGDSIWVPVEAGETLYAGTLVCIDAQGYAINASDAADQKPIGVVRDTVVNTGGADGDILAEVWMEGQFEFAIAATCTIADVGKWVYVVDNQTISLTKATNSGPIGILTKCVSTTKARIKLMFLRFDDLS